MTEGLVIGLSTRGRPALVQETLGITLANITRDDTRVLVFVDDDDTATREMLEAKNFPAFKGRLFGVVRPRPDTIGEKWNWMAEEDGEAYMVAVDHSAHVTPGFDQIVLDGARRFGGAPGAVFGPLANLSFPSVNACTRAWVDRVGYIYPPYFPYWFTDHWFDDVARMTEQVEIVNVRVDSSRKPFTQELREPAWWATWFDAALVLRTSDALKVLGSLTPPEMDAFRRRTALVTQDSRAINDTVRAQSGALAGVSKLRLTDERYLRAKLNAREMLPKLLSTLPPAEAEAFAKALEQPAKVATIPQAYRAVMREESVAYG